MTDFDDLDIFADDSLVVDPYPYFDRLRDKCPVLREPYQGVLAVSGHEEALAVYRDSDTFSSCISMLGPFSGLPEIDADSDVGELIEQYRDQLPLSEHLVAQDPPVHTRGRELLKKLLTPKRLRENEEFMWRLADQHIDEFIERGECEVIEEFAKPFSLLVIADLLGVPEEDHEEFRVQLGARTVGGMAGEEAPTAEHNPLEFLDTRFTAYVEDRRGEPRDDVLTGLATAKYPDGSLPEVVDVVRIATFLFAAGQETTAKLIAFAMQIMGDRPELQQQLRDDRGLIPSFLEETLRLEGPVKTDFRLARTATTIGGVDVPAGSTLMILPGAANRDPRRFEDPHEFRVDRPNVREHIAFGRGVHSCPGGPLARVEGRVSLERLLDRLADITVSEEKHGPVDARRYSYEPTFIVRGLTELHVKFTPVA